MMTIEHFKEHSRTFIALALATWIGFLILLALLASAVDNFPKIKKDPSPPPVYFPDHPRTDENGCTRIDGIDICPLASLAPTAIWRGGTALSTPSLRASADTPPAKGPFKRDPYGETRFKATPDAIKSLKLVSRVLEVKKPIDVHAATFKDGPAAYARYLGRTSEIVYSKDTYARVTDGDRLSWALIGLWGHEVGHVKYREKKSIENDRWENEASAEFFAGVAIYRLGGDFRDTLVYTNVFNGEDDKHPPHSLGILLTQEGWRQAKARHEDPANTCTAGLIGREFVYKTRICKAAISCADENRPVVFACQKPGGDWKWL